MNKKSREMAEIERLLPSVPPDPLPEGDAVLLNFARNDASCREWTLSLLRRGQRPVLRRTEVPTEDADVCMAEMVLESPGCAQVALDSVKEPPSRTPTVDIVLDKVADKASGAAFKQYVEKFGFPDDLPATREKVDSFIAEIEESLGHAAIARLNAALALVGNVSGAEARKMWATLKSFGIVPENLVAFLLERDGLFDTPEGH